MTSASRTFPFNLRWRLAIAFLAVASIASGVVAAGAYGLVRTDRFASFRDRATSTTNLAVTIIGNATAQAEPDLGQMLNRLTAQGSFEVLIEQNGESISSSSAFGPEAVSALRDVEADEHGHASIDVEVGGRTGLLLSPQEISGVEVYLFFSKESLNDQMAALASSLWRAWLAVTALAGALGYVLARRTLRPVAHASEAARSLAEGLLETRLPVDREDEFGAWAVSFNEMADELQDKIEALTQARDREIRFTSDVAHELKTPLTALVASAQLLRPHVDQLDGEAEWAARHLLSEIVRLQTLVEELLEISRLDAGQETVALHEIRLAPFLSALVKRQHWDEAVEVNGQDHTVETDPRRLERILSNLLTNAVTHGRPPIVVRSDIAEDRLRIRVTDHGGGITQEQGDQIFDRFYKADPARAGGTGLGLAIAQEHAALLGGTIILERGDGSTTFVVDLPKG